jgi:hypothetical protein
LKSLVLSLGVLVLCDEYTIKSELSGLKLFPSKFMYLKYNLHGLFRP